VVTAADADGALSIAERGRVVISTAGPFAEVGSPLVAACAATGTDYVDTTGETPWVRGVIDRHDDEARANGALIVPMCGFDSVPSDLIARAAAERLLRECGVRARRVRTYISMVGRASGGTIETGIRLARDFREEYGDPFLLGGADGARGARCAEDRDVVDAALDPQWGVWTAPFGMAKINTRVVRRSAALSLARDGARSPYADDFAYSEVAVAQSEGAARRAAKTAAIGHEVLSALVARGRLPRPGEGPSASDRAAARYKFTAVAEAEAEAETEAEVEAEAEAEAVGARGGGVSGARRRAVTVEGRDGGYEDTAAMVGEAALLLLEPDAREAMPRGGVFTPSAAFGDALRQRLDVQGVRFDLIAPLPAGGHGCSVFAPRESGA
jgi:short subunit dehydrogenase-like uncharacterized protein